jgi:hypothetical protein
MTSTGCAAPCATLAVKHCNRSASKQLFQIWRWRNVNALLHVSANKHKAGAEIVDLGTQAYEEGSYKMGSISDEVDVLCVCRHNKLHSFHTIYNHNFCLFFTTRFVSCEPPSDAFGQGRPLGGAAAPGPALRGTPLIDITINEVTSYFPPFTETKGSFYRVQNSPPPARIPNQINSVHPPIGFPEDQF